MTGSELLMILGIVLIVFALAAGMICFCVFVHTGKKLKSKLRQEYGDNV